MTKQHRRAVSLWALCGATLVPLVAVSGCGTSDKGKNGEDLSVPAKQPAGGASGYNNRPASGSRPGSPPGPGGAR